MYRYTGYPRLHLDQSRLLSVLSLDLGPHLVFEQLPEGLNQLELQVFGESSYVVVALNGVAVLLAAAGRWTALNHIRVQGALQEQQQQQHRGSPITLSHVQHRQVVLHDAACAHVQAQCAFVVMFDACFKQPREHPTQVGKRSTPIGNASCCMCQRGAAGA